MKKLVNESIEDFLEKKKLNEMMGNSPDPDDPDDPNRWRGKKPHESWQDEFMDMILDTKGKFIKGKDFEEFADFMIERKPSLDFVIKAIDILFDLHPYMHAGLGNFPPKPVDWQDYNYKVFRKGWLHCSLEPNISTHEYVKGMDKIEEYMDDDDHWGGDGYQPDPVFCPSETCNIRA